MENSVDLTAGASTDLDGEDHGGWPDSADGRFKASSSVLTFYIRLPFPLPLTPANVHRFSWYGARYANPESEQQFGGPPFVDARFMHISVTPEYEPPVRPGYFEGLSLLQDEGQGDEEGIEEANRLLALPPKDAKLIQTWVILLTPAVLLEGEDASHLQTACFERAIREMNHMIRAYSFIIEDPRVHPVNKEQLDPLVTWELKDARSGEAWAQGPFLLHHNYPGLVAEPPSQQQESLIFAVVFRAAHGDPFFKYRDWLNRAKHSRFYRGDYEEAIIRLQISVESLCYGLAQSVWVDAHLPVAEIERRLGEIDSFAALMKRTLPAQLGGNWDLTDGTRPVGRYWRDLYLTRNRLAHAGRRIDFYDATRAFEAFDQLMEFIVGRLLSRPRNYPRTILAFLGQPGLERRGAWSPFLRDFASQISKEGPPFWWPDDVAGRVPGSSND
jgi:hypothetical protein